MAAQYHSKICAHAYTAMEELFGAGLIDPQSMVHFDALCRTDAKERAPSRPPMPPWFAELREEEILPKKAAAPSPKAHVATKPKPASQAPRTPSVKAPTIPASHVTGAGTSAKTQKEVRAQATRRVTASNTKRPEPIAPSPAARAKRESPKAPASSMQMAQPKAPPVLPKAEVWQFPQAAPTFQHLAFAAAARPATPAATEQPPSRQRSAAELRQLREREGVSEAVFARCLGVPPQTVIAWEGGIVLPSPRVSRLLTTIEEKGLNAVG